jgi:hypothetical protein
MKEITVKDTLHLPVDKRIELVCDIWDSISAVPEAVELTGGTKSAVTAWEPLSSKRLIGFWNPSVETPPIQDPLQEKQAALGTPESLSLQGRLLTAGR